MTSKEKAKELKDKFFWKGAAKYPEQAKTAALICVNECLKMLDGLHKPEYTSFDIYEPKQYTMPGEPDFDGYIMQAYWEQVKEEIEKL